MEPHRLRAPRADQTVLAEPPLAEAPALLRENLDQLARWDHDFQGRRTSRLRAMARSQILAAAREHLGRFGVDFAPPTDGGAPLVVTGHQPELFHPGVWIKNFSVAALAKQNGGVALNLIVDNDIPKSSAIRVPQLQDGRLRSPFVDFDGWSGEVPYEDWSVADEATFASFGSRVRETLGGLVPDPMIDDAWPVATRSAGITDRIGLRFSAARRSIERAMGVANAEVPLSLVCETEAFRWFACHLLAHLPRFQAVHNAALASYRSLYGIRSKNHPVPRLDREGDWLESPFWVWRKESPRRRPLMARQGPNALDLRIAGESRMIGSLRLTADREACCAVEDLHELGRQGIRIRTRALTTTMFARLLLGDLFVHGIGGAKYDELGDEVVRGFFGIGPPGYLTLSMTLWLGLDADPTAADRLRALDRARRDLIFRPERYLGDSTAPQILGLIEAKQAAVAAPVGTRKERVSRFHRIRRANEALAPFLTAESNRLGESRSAMEEVNRKNAVAMGRDWSYVLHSRSRWEATMRRLWPTLVPT